MMNSPPQPPQSPAASPEPPAKRARVAVIEVAEEEEEEEEEEVVVAAPPKRKRPWCHTRQVLFSDFTEHAARAFCVELAASDAATRFKDTDECPGGAAWEFTRSGATRVALVCTECKYSKKKVPMVQFAGEQVVAHARGTMTRPCFLEYLDAALAFSPVLQEDVEAILTQSGAGAAADKEAAQAAASTWKRLAAKISEDDMDTAVALAVRAKAVDWYKQVRCPMSK